MIDCCMWIVALDSMLTMHGFIASKSMIDSSVVILHLGTYVKIVVCIFWVHCTCSILDLTQVKFDASCGIA
jgi:hypothetical protein